MGPAFRSLLLLTGAATIASCSMQPDYEPPRPEMPAAYRETGAAPAEADGEDAARDESLPQPQARWWRHFGSAELDALVAEALANNRDLKAAVSRIEQARALAGIAGAPLLPTVSVTGAGESKAPAGGIGSRVPGGPKNAKLYEIGVQASYELDLWGKNSSAASSALATATASLFDRETVAISLVADVATSYFAYLQAEERLRVAARKTENVNTLLETVGKRFEIGEGTKVEVAQQRSALAEARSEIPVLELDRARARNRLAVLLGRPPQSLELKGKELLAVSTPRIRAGLPSDLLLRRPDVRKAEADLVAANADIGVARAKLLPSFALTAERGFGSQHLATLLSPASIFYTLAADIAFTVFDNARASGEIALNQARYEELVQAYAQAVLAALRDVEDALAALHFLGQQEEAQQLALEEARQAYDLSKAAYGIGMAHYLSVLEAERSKFRAEDNVARTRFARLNAAVLLYKALGGGASPEPLAQGGAR